MNENQDPHLYTDFKSISNQQLDLLSQQQFLVIDQFFETNFAKTFSHDLKSVFAQFPTWFRHAGISRNHDLHLNLNVRDDRMTWLDQDLIQKCKENGLINESLSLQRFDLAMLRLQETLNQQLWLGLKSYEIQIAVYQPLSKGYQAHLDSFKGKRNRMISCVWYLNENWNENEGGALFLPEYQMEIWPEFNRFVMFQSEEVLHGVRANMMRERWAVAVWFRSMV
jgi:SM-20-related protein